jgi:predicted ATPase/class 3 adenylate cyclase
MHDTQESSLLPSGTVTFLFTDIEGSTKLWEQHPEAMGRALAQHDRVLGEAIESRGGFLVKTTGDGVHAVFRSAVEAAAAVRQIQEQLQALTWGPTGPLRVRAALYTGEAELREGDYYGQAVNRAARLMSIAAGGQILISDSTAAMVRDRLPGEATLSDLGEHRLRSLDRVERVYQLLYPGLQSDFPPLASSRSNPNNLPIQLTSFIGRDKETARLAQLLVPDPNQGDEHKDSRQPRLITLTGPGGTGKTRLSLHVAAGVIEHFPDGVWLVELAPVTDPNVVTQTIAAPLGIFEQTGRPLVDMLVDYLHAKKALLILDNCEHLIDECAQLAETLLRACPELRILASSREALGIAGEQAVRIRSMALPTTHDGLSVEQLAGYEAISLFTARAQAVNGDFALSSENAPYVLQICQRLDGIPLAIELAAARVRVLSPDQIATRLDDRFRLLTGGSRTALPRQRTLQALIDWSYDLLSEMECILLRRLSVFSGGWTLEAAELVTGTEPLEPYDVLDLMEQLVNKSLVAADESESTIRYRMLETVRQYAQERLAESGEATDARNRHLAYFVDQNLHAWQALLELRPTELVIRLGIEGDNIRAARAWALEHDLGAALSLAAYRSSRLNQYLPAVEALRFIETVLEKAETSVDYVGTEAPSENRSVLAAAYVSASVVSYAIGRNIQTLEYALIGAELARDIDDRQVLGWALGLASAASRTLGDLEPAIQMRDESLALAQETGNRWMEAISLVLGLAIPVTAEEVDQLWSDWEAGMALFRNGDELWGQGLGHYIASFTLMHMGEMEEAKRHAILSLEMWTAIGDKHFANAPRGMLAEMARMSGELDEAEEFYEQAAPIWRDLGNYGAVARCLECLAFIIRARVDSGPEGGGDAESQATRLGYAVTLLGAAGTIREGYNAPMTAVEKPEYEKEKTAITKLVGELAYEDYWRDGRTLNIDQIIARVASD